MSSVICLPSLVTGYPNRCPVTSMDQGKLQINSFTCISCIDLNCETIKGCRGRADHMTITLFPPSPYFPSVAIRHSIATGVNMNQNYVYSNRLTINTKRSFNMIEEANGTQIIIHSSLPDHSDSFENRQTGA